MRVMDIDPEVLEVTANASRHATEQTYIHMESEIKGIIDPLMETLTPQGPYAYTILPEVRPDGSVHLPILTTREEIEEAYLMVRGGSALFSVIPLTEIRGEWYTFQDNISAAELRATGERMEMQTLGIFPSGGGSGITGELIWVRVPRAALGARDAKAAETREEKEEMFVRQEVLFLHERYMEALRLGDVDAVLDTFNDAVASAVRDYVNDTGTLTTLEGKDAHRPYYEALFEKYDIQSVQALDRVAEEWFIFAELRMTVTPRGGASSGALSFNTAEFFIPANDGRFIARIGHGTDPV
jgi:hypothetical protein